MNIDLPPPKPTLGERRRRAKRRALILTLVAAGAGLACYALPKDYQQPCHICAKVLSIVLSSH